MFHLPSKTAGRLAVFAVTCLAVGSALAHPDHPETMMNGSMSFSAGFSHPFSGIDHLLAMNDFQLPAVESGIAASVAVLGLLIAFAVRMPLWASTAIVSVFAIFHGYAHGSELPHGSSAALYGAGFVLATAILHVTGLVLGLVAGQQMADKVVRFGGAAIAAVGAYLLTAV